MEQLLVGDHYARIRHRLSDTVANLSTDELERPVPACPGWRVRDVIAHLLGVAEDAIAGRLQGPPSEAMTAEQVARHQDDSIEEMLTEWERLAELFEPAISEMQAWAAAFDVLSHDFDIAHALDRAPTRDDPLVAVMAPMLAGRLAGHAALVLDGQPCAVTPPAPLELRTSAFEFVRAAMGRRSLDQAVALDWSSDPSAVMGRMFVFGPATDEIVEALH